VVFIDDIGFYLNSHWSCLKLEIFACLGACLSGIMTDLGGMASFRKNADWVKTEFVINVSGVILLVC